MLRLRGDNNKVLAVCKKSGSTFRVFRPLQPFYAAQQANGAFEGAPLFLYATVAMSGDGSLAVSPVSSEPGVYVFQPAWTVVDGPKNSFQKKIFVNNNQLVAQFQYNTSTKLHQVTVTGTALDLALLVCLTHIADLAETDKTMNKAGKAFVQGTVANPRRR